VTDGHSSLEERLGRLREAAEAARSIGLEAEADAAEEVAERIARRSGFVGPVYVMALAGGTGVGKSSILNALAGRVVSPARAVRPTTDAPIAWVPAAHQAGLAPLLDWLKVSTVVSHDGGGLDDVAILDLPDMDSVRLAHRATVDELLPRIDAVTWVVDPEKYDDASEHAYWRSLAPHAERLQFVLNKADRLTDADARRVIDDLRARLSADGISGTPIHLVSALNGAGVEPLRAALADAGEAKAIVAAKLQTDLAKAADRLADAVGLDAGADRTLLADERRGEVERAAVEGALALVDVEGLAQQVRAAVLHRARVGGGSLLSRLVALTATLTGRRHRRADPAAYLRAWRSRGALGRVLNPLRGGLLEAASALPAASRGRILDAIGSATVEADVERVLDRAVASAGADLEIPRSPIWPVIGVVQALVGAVTVFALAWIVVLFVAGGGVPVGTFDAPLLGPVPVPLALLAASVLVSAALGWIVGLHAGWVGRRVAARLASRTELAVREAVVDQAFAGLDRVEQGRRTIADAR
jgi:GTP-binding protein EngB required for normal cell division